ncbi:hypothetical protein [Tichowtungia aerotolerans]|uniref:PA14 domain-containing protein n=1 Tax=Tichowtungia aerotolerans TaxID=2697043 RepID=A0A6P1M6D1_9BACT|nr:hypothetical protein [Tichowtungia aerotolerans]QHI70359.1 hypothetical protein GT409_13220 [Tichowtungia aerotolerans]
MKKVVKRTKGLIKGRSPAVLVSAAIHAALLLSAGVFVVFQIVDRKEVQFVPHKVERPKMKLKKLRVKVKQTVKPRKTTERITSSRRSNIMPDIQLPKMSSMGSGLDEGIGGFQMMADLSQMGLMGTDRSVGNDFEGTYYYLMLKRNGTPYPGMSNEAGARDPIHGEMAKVIKEFLSSGWDPKVFDPFWRSPKKLYATQIFVPPVSSTLAPEKFGDTDRTHEAAFWVAHYKGEIGHKTGGRFRFWGIGDDIMFVRLNGKIVLDAGWTNVHEADWSGWRSSAKEHRKYQISHTLYRVGDWFELKPGETMDMEVLIGEVPGGGYMALLMVQEEGVEYPERDLSTGGPLLPVFKTMETPEHLIDEMMYTLPSGHVDLYGGPIFSAH